jgi:hypothetical protein
VTRSYGRGAGRTRPRARYTLRTDVVTVGPIAVTVEAIAVGTGVTGANPRHGFIMWRYGGAL